MKKTVTVFSALVALMIILSLSVTLANDKKIASNIPNVEPTSGVDFYTELRNAYNANHCLDYARYCFEPIIKVSLSNVSTSRYNEFLTEMEKTGGSMTMIQNRDNPAFWVTSSLDEDEYEQFMTNYLASAHFFNKKTTSIVIVGASWDIPLDKIPGVDMSDIRNLSANIEVAAYDLSNGADLIVAGGQEEGGVSESTYQAIIDRAKQMDPNHSGSIVRVAGKDPEQTARFIHMYQLNVGTRIE